MGTNYSLLVVIVLGYVGLRYWRQRSGADPTDRSAGFRPSIGFSRLDGMESLSLLLENKSRKNVWVEELEIFLSTLSAEDQTAEATLHGIQKIRQMVPSGDLLPISLAQVIYKAAGGPQRNYSCVLSAVLRYRIGQEEFEKQMESYRVRMLGLTATGIQGERKPLLRFETSRKPQDVPAMAAREK